MRKVLIPILFIVSGCSSVANRPGASMSGLIEVTPVSKSGVYLLRGVEYKLSELERILISEDKRNPILKVHVVQGKIGLNIAQMIEISTIAQKLEAKAFYQTGGEFKPINMVP